MWAATHSFSKVSVLVRLYVSRFPCWHWGVVSWWCQYICAITQHAVHRGQQRQHESPSAGIFWDALRKQSNYDWMCRYLAKLRVHGVFAIDGAGTSQNSCKAGVTLGPRLGCVFSRFFTPFIWEADSGKKKVLERPTRQTIPITTDEQCFRGTAATHVIARGFISICQNCLALETLILKPKANWVKPRQKYLVQHYPQKESEIFLFALFKTSHKGNCTMFFANRLDSQ